MISFFNKNSSRSRRVLLLPPALMLLLITTSSVADWGFFAHRRINRMAVFTLPPDMIGFYKENVEYITEHAVDPDKRRYATRHEAVRHYIDIDHWGEYPFPEVPRDWTECLMKYTDLYQVMSSGDTVKVDPDLTNFSFNEDKIIYRNLPNAAYRRFFTEQIMPQYYEEKWIIDLFDWGNHVGPAAVPDDCVEMFAVDRFSAYGILPFHLNKMQRDLTRAFEQQSPTAILRLSAEMGHYIGDAHVPLHTTENYNGQLTDQVGIHAFWESRLPELFADTDYDFFVGQARYIDDPADYFWSIVLESHRLLDSVLVIEKELSNTFPRDKQYCYEERLDQTIRTQCQEYSAAYHNRMNGMVERRMREAVLSIGSSWYTAWVDAGQPDLDRISDHRLSKKEQDELEELNKLFNGGEIKGREH